MEAYGGAVFFLSGCSSFAGLEQGYCSSLFPHWKELSEKKNPIEE